ncbi:hypothetical protein [Thalassospira sp.]|uniref:hypothetical protein n=1 Tax=Thalassospira sp. TaxID=1912094 RepID=UPI0025CE5E3B|nr:hypothetical protein [Thalassospira sp.]|tara:strand:+ start:346 stop:1674 length:1329 start_codon:yes stop_codon:yes gene_type:complete
MTRNRRANKTVEVVKYHFSSLTFSPYNNDNQWVAELRGIASLNSFFADFTLKVTSTPYQKWQLVALNWSPMLEIPSPLRSRQFAQSILNRASRILDPTNMWPTEQLPQGAKSALNIGPILDEHSYHTCVSSRHETLSLPTSSWESLWHRIERRAKHDPYFEVLGCSRAELITLLPELKALFNYEWVRAQYKKAGFSNLSAPLESEDQGFFPAYHLARTALGGICRDPGWVYLAEIGRALITLKNVDGIEILKRGATQQSGVQHHLCFAAELHERGLLHSLEPLSGSGSARCDLIAMCGNHHYQIELKELTSKKPLKRLKAELSEKCRKLPKHPKTPIVFYVVFREVGAEDAQLEQTFFNEIKAIEDMIPPKISAVVAGRRFVDATGGRVKHDTEIIALNKQAITPANPAHLDELFRSNYEVSEMPFFGVTSFFIFGPRREND